MAGDVAAAAADAVVAGPPTVRLRTAWRHDEAASSPGRRGPASHVKHVGGSGNGGVRGAAAAVHQDEDVGKLQGLELRNVPLFFLGPYLSSMPGEASAVPPDLPECVPDR